MRNKVLVGDLIIDHFKGVTPKYAEVSNTIVLNQKCIRDNRIYWDLARHIDESQTFSEKKYLKMGDILINSTGVGTAGRCTYLNEIPNGYKLVTDSHILVLRCKDQFIAELLAYYLFSIEEKLMSFMTGSSGQGELDKMVLFQIETLFPVKEIESKQIAKVLSDLDAKIELNNKINAELEDMAKLIYDYWFVQFNYPGKNGKPYKSSGGKMVYNAELKREIPEGWEVVELQDIANITMGQSPPGDSYNEEGIGKVFYQGCTDFGSRFPTNRKFTTQPSRHALEGDILLSVRAPVGTMNIANEDCCIGRGLAALNSKIGSISYLDGVLRYLKQVFDRRNTDGTTFGSITKGDLFSLLVIKPNDDVLKNYNSIVHPMFEKQNKIGLENQHLSSLRDWLLPMLMNGQVSVRTAYEKLEEVELGVAAEGEGEYK